MSITRSTKVGGSTNVADGQLGPAADLNTDMNAVFAAVNALGLSISLDTTNTTEATTASTSAADVRTITLATAAPAGAALLIMASWRKSAGAASYAAVGLKLNSTTVCGEWDVGSTVNQAESGFLLWFIGPRTTSYLRSGIMLFTNGVDSRMNPAELRNINTADLPTASVTSVTVTGLVGNASVTLGITDVAVYQLSRS